jgi:ABC-type sugar transport system ATPase subunit
MIYATHDYEEAMAMADRILVINAGRAEQTGVPFQVYEYPQSAFVASVLGSPAMNLIPCRAERGEGQVIARTEAFQLRIPWPVEGELPAEGLLGIRPEHLQLRPAGQGDVQASVDIVQALGDEQIADLSLADGTILKVVADLDHVLHPGATVGLHLMEEHLFLFDRQSGQRVAGPPPS